MYQINALNPKDEGHKARKRFGQNFLHDQRVIAKIVRSVNPRTGDNIVEIGPDQAFERVVVIDFDQPKPQQDVHQPVLPDSNKYLDQYRQVHRK
ncbi:hypothetical protein A7A56_13385 [Acinetobacter baumannii]|nr:hypothetical protein A7A56_13385 [Acinetobacter baumannii]